MLVTPVIGDGVGMLKSASIAHPMPVAPATYFVHYGRIQLTGGRRFATLRYIALRPLAVRYVRELRRGRAAC